MQKLSMLDRPFGNNTAEEPRYGLPRRKILAMELPTSFIVLCIEIRDYTCLECGYLAWVRKGEIHKSYFV